MSMLWKNYIIIIEEIGNDMGGEVLFEVVVGSSRI